MTLDRAFLAIGQGILIATGARYIGLLIPFCLIAIWAIQKFYLRTSRQLRFVDLETKSPLYSHFLETLEGLRTIRAFGWQEAFAQRNMALLDASQKPFYLLYCIQRWLNLVLDLLVAALAVILMTMAVKLTALTSGGALGVALVNVLSFNQSLSGVVTQWTQLETSLGAVSRIRSFVQNTKPEDQPQEIQIPFKGWPNKGAIEIKDITASYK